MKQDLIITKQEEVIEFLKTQSIDSPFKEDAEKYKKLLSELASLKQGSQEKESLRDELVKFAIHVGVVPEIAGQAVDEYLNSK
jgi:hypothetical protein